MPIPASQKALMDQAISGVNGFATTVSTAVPGAQVLSVTIRLPASTKGTGEHVPAALVFSWDPDAAEFTIAT